MKEQAIKAFDESASVKHQFVHEHAERIEQVVKLIATAFREGRKVLLFGNGGSATDAAHIAAEFVGRYHRDRVPLPAIALATDIAAITCIANDYGYELKGVEAARAIGLTTIAWTGGSGGKLAGMVDHPFVVPSKVTARIQEIHITLGHVLCELIEEQLLGKTS